MEARESHQSGEAGDWVSHQPTLSRSVVLGCGRGRGQADHACARKEKLQHCTERGTDRRGGMGAGRMVGGLGRRREPRGPAGGREQQFNFRVEKDKPSRARHGTTYANAGSRFC